MITWLILKSSSLLWNLLFIIRLTAPYRQRASRHWAPYTRKTAWTEAGYFLSSTRWVNRSHHQARPGPEHGEPNALPIRLPHHGRHKHRLNTTLPDFACIIQVADKNVAYSYKWATYGLRRKTGSKDGLLAASNDFTDPSWGLWPSPAGESAQRRENLYALGEKFKGKINVGTMKKILLIPASFFSKTNSDSP